MMPNQMSPVEKAVTAQQGVIEALTAHVEDIRGVVLQIAEALELGAARMDLMHAHVENLIERVYVLENERVYMLETNVDQLLGRDDES